MSTITIGIEGVSKVLQITSAALDLIAQENKILEISTDNRGLRFNTIDSQNEFVDLIEYEGPRGKDQ